MYKGAELEKVILALPIFRESSRETKGSVQSISGAIDGFPATVHVGWGGSSAIININIPSVMDVEVSIYLDVVAEASFRTVENSSFRATGQWIPVDGIFEYTIRASNFGEPGLTAKQKVSVGRKYIEKAEHIVNTIDNHLELNYPRD